MDSANALLGTFARRVVNERRGMNRAGIRKTSENWDELECGRNFHRLWLSRNRTYSERIQTENISEKTSRPWSVM